MKTNQIMRVALMNGEIQVGHKDKFGSVTDLFTMGNKYRSLEGRNILRYDRWLAMSSTKEFVAIVTEKIGEPATRSKRGKVGGIWAHLFVLLDAAAYLSPKLKYEIYDTFVNKKILDWRDRSGDEYIELDASIALAAENIFGKPAHKGHYINIAKIIKKRLGVDQWNLATAKQLNDRTRIEEGLTMMLKSNVVKDWDHLKSLAGSV